MGILKKRNPRRDQVRKTIAAERYAKMSRFATADVMISLVLGALFAGLVWAILLFRVDQAMEYKQVIATGVMVILITLLIGIYIHHYQKRIVRKHARAGAIVGMFILFLAMTRFGILAGGQPSWATGTAIATAIILSIAYNQRFALGMSIFYCVFAMLAASNNPDAKLFLTMAAGSVACCFSLGEIRTRMKLLEVSALAAVVVFVSSVSLEVLSEQSEMGVILSDAGWHVLATVFVGLLIQSLLPAIEKVFRIATSMTLLDYSDANQPLLRRLAMEAPGTYSHSLLVGSIAESAAESIGRNGLLCRVGAYYHDVGKINKPGYFVENEMGSSSMHKELSPAMSQLVIVGHVKDGIEMAKEYGLPSILHQFIESHHGKTLVEYFYNQAKKQKKDQNAPPPSDSEFRYSGPKPRTKEAAIVMLADAAESAVRSLGEVTPNKVECMVHDMAMKRLQDGQFDKCDLSLRELSQIEASISKSLAAHYHGRISYNKSEREKDENKTSQQVEGG